MPARDKDGNIIVSTPTGKYTHVDGELVEVGALHERSGKLAARERHARTNAQMSQALQEADSDWPEDMSHIGMFRKLAGKLKYSSLPGKSLKKELAVLARKKGRRVIGDRTRS